LSRANVEATFSGLRRFIKSNGWIGKNNRYSTDTVAKIVSELRAGNIRKVELLQTAGLTANSTMFWWNNLGVARGLWDGPKSADQLTDLWADIDLILRDLETFQQKHGASNQSFLRVGSELGSSLVGLGSCERVAIWSMTPSI
jgi:hypothetical protein